MFSQIFLLSASSFLLSSEGLGNSPRFRTPLSLVTSCHRRDCHRRTPGRASAEVANTKTKRHKYELDILRKRKLSVAKMYISPPRLIAAFMFLEVFVSRLTLYIPEDVLLRRCGIKDVEPHCVHTVLLHHLLRVQTIVFRLAHLLPRNLDTAAATRHRLLIWKRTSVTTQR